MASTRHVSRWRLCRLPEASTSSEISVNALPSTFEPVAKVAASTPPVSLRYLNEFVGKLHCASALLEHGLFPDAKEITESMAMFNAVRRYIEPRNKETSQETNGKHDGIVVVGDGNTPRTGAMFAFRMRGWTSYSVDPAMENGTSERSKGWTDVSNLVVMRNKIEDVRITLRRAIVVLVHAHVTLEQALSAVQAEQICGVVTLPCCNWYGQQELLFGRGPDLVYDDFSVLSDHREIRLWVGDESGSNVDTAHADLSLVSSVMKGCVCKEYMALGDENGFGASFDKDMDTKNLVDDLRKKHDGVLDFISDTLAELVLDVSLLSREKYMAEEQTIGNCLPSAVVSKLRSDSHVLVFGWHPRRLAVRLLLRDGYTNVYTVSLADELSFTIDDNNKRGIKTLKLQLQKCTSKLNMESGSAQDGEEETVQLHLCGYLTLQSSFALSRAENCCDKEEEEPVIVSFVSTGAPVPPLACVFDAGFIFRGFRGRAKKTAMFFRHLCRTFDQLVTVCSHATANRMQSPSLVCFTPRKQWRKKKFLAHPDLNYNVLSITTKEQTQGTSIYVYFCVQRQIIPASE
ncbi:unnamed protein product [Peronospora farinosa]|uniref:Methyltransferase domain-containing protein n=1 Tax=Peronospora farinosa TaxID=134698 RepID=A0AAV0TJY9_9STRA|nr:unnamed protein product [Peronospora farinosa]CAI5722336.1 unnamed protein product [Peronospora farinosa]